MGHKKTYSEDRQIERLEAILESISPDTHYGNWIRVLMAICHETRKSQRGFELADNWSKSGCTYRGTKDVWSKWRYLNPDCKTPVTMATLIWMAKKNRN